MVCCLLVNYKMNIEASQEAIQFCLDVPVVEAIPWIITTRNSLLQQGSMLSNKGK